MIASQPLRGSATRKPPPHWPEQSRKDASDDEEMKHHPLVPTSDTYLPHELENIKADPRDAENADIDLDAMNDEAVAKIQEVSEEIEKNGLNLDAVKSITHISSKLYQIK